MRSYSPAQLHWLLTGYLEWNGPVTDAAQFILWLKNQYIPVQLGKVTPMTKPTPNSLTEQL